MAAEALECPDGREQFTLRSPEKSRNIRLSQSLYRVIILVLGGVTVKEFIPIRERTRDRTSI